MGERKIGMGERSVRLGVNAVYGWVNLLGSNWRPGRQELEQPVRQASQTAPYQWLSTKH